MKKTAQCETVPEGCPTDGHHVYWSPDETSVAKQCWEIGTQGPCEDGKLIHLEQNKEELKVYCRPQFFENIFKNSLANYRPCYSNSKRGQNNQCRQQFYG